MCTDIIIGISMCVLKIHTLALIHLQLNIVCLVLGMDLISFGIASMRQFYLILDNFKGIIHVWTYNFKVEYKMLGYSFYFNLSSRVSIFI